MQIARHMMTRRSFLEFTGAVGAAAAMPLPLAARESPPWDRPNILFILTDDQGFGDLSRHCNPVLKTPKIVAELAAAYDQW